MIQHPLKPFLHQVSWKSYLGLLQRKRTPLTTKHWDELIYFRAYTDFEFFARYFFAHHCRAPFSKMHQAFFIAEAEPARRGRREAIAAPRGHAKTTFKALIKSLHAIVYGYEPFILIIGHSASEASGKVRDILEELETNQRLIQIYGMIAPKQGQKETGEWGKKSFVTQNGIKVLAKSRGQQLRGVKYGPNRPSLIICDDVESSEGVLNPEQRNKTRDWFTKDVLKCGQIDGSTNVMIIGTCLHPQSLLSELLTSPGWASQKYQAVLSFSKHPELWDEWKALYTNLSNRQRHEQSQTYLDSNRKAMLEGTEVLWPEGEPYEVLIKQQVDEGMASFQSEKQNEPYDPERQLFNMALAKRVQVIFNGKDLQELRWLDGSGKVVSNGKLTRIIAFHDPALGKKSGQHTEPDYAAIVVVGQDREGYLYCLDVYLDKSSPSTQIEKAIELHKKWNLNALYLETNHFQELLKQNYREALTQHPGVNLRVLGVQQHENKYKRISTLEPYITNGHLLFSDRLDVRLIQMLELFPTGYDDGPDALQGAVAELKRLTTSQIFDKFYN